MTQYIDNVTFDSEVPNVVTAEQIGFRGRRGFREMDFDSGYFEMIPQVVFEPVTLGKWTIRLKNISKDERTLD